jgi:DNA-binding winged helix-turn-helix (wHTH) protein
VELDPKSGDIWKDGVRSRLPEQPLAVLNALLESPGEVVSRDVLQKRLWAADTFVDFGLRSFALMLRLSRESGNQWLIDPCNPRNPWLVDPRNPWPSAGHGAPDRASG